MKMVSRSLCALVMLTLASGCSTRGGRIPYETALAVPDFGTRDALPADLAIGPNDRIQVTVFRVPELTGEFRVGPDGFAHLPLLGAVDLRDRTAGEASALIGQRYGAEYLRDPKVTVSVLESSQRTFTVEGGVQQPGIFPVAGKTDLLSAVAAARGINRENGNDRRVAIFREIGGQQMAAAFDLKAVRDGTMINPEVYPGDLIVVQSNNMRALFRDVLTTIPIIAIFNPLQSK